MIQKSLSYSDTHHVLVRDYSIPILIRSDTKFIDIIVDNVHIYHAFTYIPSQHQL